MIVIQSGFGETSVAVLENNKLIEFHTERLYREKLAGNIYLGIVENVLPGMQAAFVDIGLNRNALLHSDDIILAKDDQFFTLKTRKPVIADIVKKGQEILVQVAKEGTGTKGPRVTTRISLPGRFIVLMPSHDHLFISRRIHGEEERSRVKEMALEYKKPGIGAIVRTAAQEASPEDFQADFSSLEALWASINDKRKGAQAPRLLHRDLELVPGLLRDLLSTEVERILVNSPETKEEVMEIIGLLTPDLEKRVTLKEGDLFELFKIPSQLEQALNRRVWLNCGGYLVIDSTEALTAIDVNTGRFTGSTNLGDTALKVNLEAATEIGRQLRLRNIAGMIIVDFIDMPNEDYWELVLAELKNQTKKDRIKTQILGLTKLGLVEISRKKTRKSLSGLWLRNCPYCKGRAKVLGLQAVVNQVRQKLYSMAKRTAAEGILAKMNSQVAAMLIETTLKELKRETGKEIVILGRKEYHRETMELEALYSYDDIDKKLVPLTEGQIIRWMTAEKPSPMFTEMTAQLEGYNLEIQMADSLDWTAEQGIYLELIKVHGCNVKAKLLPS